MRTSSVTERGRGTADQIGRGGYDGYSQACIVVYFRYVDAMQAFGIGLLGWPRDDTTLSRRQHRFGIAQPPWTAVPGSERIDTEVRSEITH